MTENITRSDSQIKTREVPHIVITQEKISPSLVVSLLPMAHHLLVGAPLPADGSLRLAVGVSLLLGSRVIFLMTDMGQIETSNFKEIAGVKIIMIIGTDHTLSRAKYDFGMLMAGM